MRSFIWSQKIDQKLAASFVTAVCLQITFSRLVREPLNLQKSAAPFQTWQNQLNIIGIQHFFDIYSLRGVISKNVKYLILAPKTGSRVLAVVGSNRCTPETFLGSEVEICMLLAETNFDHTFFKGTVRDTRNREWNVQGETFILLKNQNRIIHLQTLPK